MTEAVDEGRSHARVIPTVAALMRRGLDSDAANRLRRLGLTLAELRRRGDADLAALGLSETDVAALRSGARPPIPFETLVRVLWTNRSACCVCRAFDRAIILHHIVPWATSRSHDPSNLAVLCLEHHAQAHRTGILEQNLGKRQLREYKRLWEEEVRHLDPRAILDATRVDGHRWWWFNHVRLLEMAEALGVDLTRLPAFGSVLARGWVDREGGIAERHMASPYLYVGGDGMLLYRFMRHVAEAVFGATTIFNLSDDLDPGFLRRVVQPGDLVLVQGRHVFRALNRVDRGPGQSSEVRRQANGVRVSFAIDRWEAVANSSWSVWLSGAKAAASVVRVVSVGREDGHLHLRCTGLAVGSALQGLSTRHYLHATWEEPELDEEPFDDGFGEPGGEWEKSSP